MSEVKQLQAAIKGDAAAFEKIVMQYQSLVCAITFSGTGRVDVSEELAQETFLNAWKNLRQLRDLGGFRAWLCTIARNMVHNYYREKKPAPLDPAHLAGVTDQAPGPSENAISQEEQAMLEQTLMQLPEDYRQPLVMYYRQGQSTKQVAASLGMNESTVRTRLHRARQMVREEIATRLEKTLEKTAPDKTFTKAVMVAL
ncbi:MAG: RNA polymerase sigma factor, partial [Planctomycetota bacterium]